jgi:hypothetical protein
MQTTTVGGQVFNLPNIFRSDITSFCKHQQVDFSADDSETVTDYQNDRKGKYGSALYPWSKQYGQRILLAL